MIRNAARGWPWLALFLLATSANAQQPAQCIDLGPAKQFNVFVRGDYWGWSSDIEGSLGTGGLAGLSGYGVGARLPQAPLQQAIATGGDLRLWSAGVYGNASYGGTPTLQNAWVEGTTTHAVTFDFEGGWQALEAASTQLAQLPANGTTTLQWGGVFLTGNDPALNVFSVPAWAVASAWGFEVNVPQGSSMLVNVVGDGARFWYMGFDFPPGFDATKVIWNLPDVTWLQIEGVGVIGSVLAPNAWITFNNGAINGQVFGSGFDGQGQTNLFPFNGCAGPRSSGEPALSLVLAAPAVAHPGTSIQYSVIAANSGSAAAATATATVTFPDGQSGTVNLGAIAAGATATASVSWTLPVPPTRGTIETSAEYVARLEALDGATLNASASLAWTDSGGAPMGPVTASVTSSERLPILAVTAGGASLAQQPAPAGPPAALAGIVNGTFDSDLNGWTVIGQASIDAFSHSGIGAARLGPTGTPESNFLSGLTQTIAVPSGGAMLSIWYSGDCFSPSARVELDDLTTGERQALLSEGCTQSGAWEQVVRGPFAGGHQVVLRLMQPSQFSSVVWFDDVTWQALDASSIDTISAPFSVTNLGSAAATAASLQAARGSTVTLGAIAPGATISIPLSATLALPGVDSAAAADYNARLAAVDTSGVTLTGSATWNDGVATYGATEASTSSADPLPVLSIAIDQPETALPQQNDTTTVTITNIGHATALNPSLNATVPFAATQVLSLPASLAPGQSATVSVDWNLSLYLGFASTEGSFFLDQSAYTPFDGSELSTWLSLSWSDSLTRTFGLQGTGRTTAIVPIVLPDTLTGTTLYPGQTYSVDWTWRNVGSAPAFNAQIGAVVGGFGGSALQCDQTEDFIVGDLAPFQSVTNRLCFTVARDSPYSPGSLSGQTITVGDTSFGVSALTWADSQGLTYTSNTHGATFTIIEPVLTIDVAGVPARVSPHQIVDAAITTTNVGTAPAFLVNQVLDYPGGAGSPSLLPELPVNAVDRRSLEFAIPADIDRRLAETDDEYRARLLSQDGTSQTVTVTEQWSDAIGGVYGPATTQSVSVLGIPILFAEATARVSAEPGQAASIPVRVRNLGSAASAGAALTLTQLDGTSSSLSVPPLDAGASIDLAVPVVMPAFAPRGVAEDEGAYRARLAAADGAPFIVDASLRWNDLAGNRYGPTTTRLEAVEVVPQLELSLSAPVLARPGESVTVEATIHSSGTSVARAATVALVLPDGSQQSPAVPALLAPRASAAAAVTSVMPTHPAGPAVARATATWQGIGGATYGPIAATTKVAYRNAAPVVSAGPPQTAFTGHAVQLAGSVGDDGLPIGGTLTWSWSAQSGPAVPSFDDPGRLNASVTFPQAGAYVLILTASDGELSASAQVQITVKSSINQPPVVSAGANQAITPLGSTPFQLHTLADVAGVTGLDWDAVRQRIVASVNFFSDGHPNNFASIGLDGTVTPLGNIAGIADEIYFAIAPGLGGFNQGEIFAITATGVISRISADGQMIASNWVAIPDAGSFRGGLRFDATGNFGGDLYASFASGVIYRIKSDGTYTRLAVAGPVQDEAGPVALVPPDSVHGDLAGRIVWMRVDVPTLYSIGLDGSVVTYPLPISAEIESVVPLTTGAAYVIAAQLDGALLASDSRASDAMNGGVIVSDESGTVTRIRVMNGTPIVNELVPSSQVFFEQAVMIPGAPATSSLTAQLNGTVSDDGLPVGGALTTQWTQVSGPGVATFDAPATLSTRVNFSIPGNYVLRLAASDGELSSSADVRLEVEQAAPPVVEAGSDLRTLFPLPVSLSGNVVRAVNTQALTYLWSQVSGPGTTRFSAIDELTTTATFDMPGTYRLRLTVSDGFLPVSSDLTVTSFAQASLAMSPTESLAIAGGAFQISVKATDPGTGSGLAGLPLRVTVSGANPEVLTAATDVSGNATVTHAGQASGDDALLAEVTLDGAAPVPVTGILHVVRPGQAISSTLVDAQFNSIGAFQVANYPYSVPAVLPFELATRLADISLSQTLASDAIVDAAGVAAGSVALPLQFCQQGIFRGALLVAAGGEQVLNPLATDFMLGISGAMRVSGPLDPAAPATTTQQHLPVVAAAANGGGAVVVHFPQAGLYPYEFDAQGCQGPMALQLGSGSSIPPAASIRLDASGGAQGALGDTEQVTLTTIGLDGRPVGGATIDVSVSGTNAQSLKATTDVNGTATVAYRAFQPGSDTIQATATLAGIPAISNTIQRAWVCCAAPSLVPIADITLPYPVNQVALDAKASGYVPPGSEIMFNWTQISGSALATGLPAPGSAVVAGFSVPGSYVLEVAATQLLSVLPGSTERVNVTVLPAPADGSLVAYAGAPQSLQLPNAVATLSGAAGLGSVQQAPPAGLAVTWSLLSGSFGVSIAEPHSLQTTATFSAPGSYLLQLAVQAGSATASSTIGITVLAPQLDSPIVSAGGERTVVLPQTLTLTGAASASLAVGESLTYRWLQVGGPVDNSGAFPVPFEIAGLPASNKIVQVSFPVAGDYAVVFGAAIAGVTDYTYDLTIIHVLDGNGIVVDAGPQQEITLPATATLRGTASPFNASVQWTQSSGPSLASLDASGSLSTRAVFPAPGVYVFTLTATSDGQTQSSMTAVVVQPASNNQPPLVSVPSSLIATFGSDVVLAGAAADDGLPAGGLLTTTWTAVSGPAAVRFSDPYSLTTHATFAAAGDYVVQLTANDSQLTASASVNAHIDPAVPPLAANAGGSQSVAYGAQLRLNGSVSSGATAAWTVLAGAGLATFTSATSAVTTATFDFPGQYHLRLTASAGGRSAFDDAIITVLTPAGSAPTVSLDSPADGARVTAPTAVLATISEGVWKLEAALGGTDDGPQTFKTLATGTATGAQQQLGKFDPTLELNGNWTLRVTAETSAGTTVVEAAVMVDGGLKMGPLSFAVTDMSVSAPGLPIALVRSYDTRNDRGPDFGNGWRLAVANVRIEKSGPIGRGWLESKRGSFAFPSYCLEETRPHTVTVTFPNGKVHRFAASVTPSCQPLAPIETPDVIFSPLDGTTSKLEILENGNTANVALGADGIPGTITLTDETSAIYNPRRYRLTLIDGTQYVINQLGGVETIVDRNGNSLTFNQQGILASNGKSVLFTRDPVTNLITAITDANGNSVQYQYDANGSLTSTTDRAGNQTQYHYDDQFRLVGVTDARGVDVLGAGYSADGRLSQMTNGVGATTSLAFDSDNLTASVADPSGNETQIDTDERGNPIRTTDPLGHVTTATFDGHDNKLTETDPLGHTTTWTYDANDNKLSETDPLGNSTSWTYNARAQVLTTTDPLGHVTTNVYDEQVRALQFPTGNLLSMTDARGNTTSYTYDQFGNLTSMTDARGGVTSSSYDDAGRLLSQIDALGNSSQYTYDANGNQLSETRTRNGHSVTTTYTYDSNGRRTKTVAADGAVTQTLYGPDGKVQSSIDALLRTTKYAYDDADRLTRTDYPDGTSNTQSYDLQGRRVSSTDRGGRTTQYTYDAAGRLTATTMPDASTRSTTYDAAGRVTSTTDELGHTTQTQYDAAGRRTQIIDALQNAASFAYDANGNQLTVTDPLGHSTTTTYDELNRAVRTTQADGTFETTEYDAQGNRSARVDAAGLRTEYGYDLLGRLIFVKDALGQYTRYAYDELGNRLSQTDANGHTTQFAYDDIGRRVSRTLPMGEQETFTYYTDGQLKTRTDFNGHTTSYAYDDAGRLVVRTPDAFFANEPAVQWTYYPSGRRKTMSDATGLTSYTYDARDRIVQRATPEGTLSYTYDAASNRRSVRSDSGVYSVDYEYDALNRLATVTDNAPGGGATSYAYDSVGRLLSFSYPNGVSHSHAYDSVNHVTSVVIATSLSTLASFSYDLYPTGNRRSATEASGRVATWSYDGLWRLVNETIAGSPTAGSVNYSLDAVGNRLSRTNSVPGLPTQVNNYDTDDRLAADTWDANGNTLASSGTQFSYDSENRLIALNGSKALYRYDGDGQLVGKTSSDGSVAYLVDLDNPTGYSQIVEERVGGAVGESYTYGPQRISMRDDAGGLHYYVYDAHSGVRALLDTSGVVTDAYEYDAFGNVLARTGTTANEFTYRGEQTDSALGLQYLRARWMDAKTGRFQTRDWHPFNVGEDPGTPYAYGDGRPVEVDDPSGHCSDPANNFQGLRGRRICINTFIPFAIGSNPSLMYRPTDMIGLLFAGDNRTDARPNGGSFRTAQYILIEPNNRVWSTYELGRSVIRGINAGQTAALAHTGVASCGDRCVEASMAASDGWLFGAAPNLQYRFKLMLFNLLLGVVGERRQFPSIEIWLYDDNKAPVGLYYYDASQKGVGDIGKTDYVLFGEGTGQTLQPYITGGYSGGSGTSVPGGGSF